MLLALNVNNTHTLVGLFEGETLVVHWRVRTDPARTVDELAVLIRMLFTEWGQPRPDIRGAAISSVVPPMNDRVQEVCRRFAGTEPLMVGPGVRTGVPILYDNPKEVGADRICNAVAAWEKLRGPAIVVDFGTATVFDAVNEQGDYLGGAIAPGIGIASEALFSRAAMLYRVQLERPPVAIGKNTINAMQSGILFGYVGLVEGLVRRFKAELTGNPKVIATGGLAAAIARETDCIDVINGDLTLTGLRLIYEMNAE